MTVYFPKFTVLSTLELVAVNAHFGALSSTRNPFLVSSVYGISYLFDEKNNISSLYDIIDLDKTMVVVKQTKTFISKFCDNHTMLWVNSKCFIHNNDSLFTFKIDYGFSVFCWQQNTQFFYIDKKSCYGLLSNFLSFYYFPNKQSLKINNQLLFKQKQQVKKNYEVDVNLKKNSPDVIFFFDIDGYQLLLQEALLLQIPTIGFCATNTTINQVFPTYTFVLNKNAYIAKYLILYELFA